MSKSDIFRASIGQGAIAWIAKHLRERWPDEPQPAEMAANLDGIAREHEVPIEKTLGWIDYHPRGSELTTASFRRWAEAYAAERERVLKELSRR
jgi:hypothetical protein